MSGASCERLHGPAAWARCAKYVKRGYDHNLHQLFPMDLFGVITNGKPSTPHGITFVDEFQRFRFDEKLRRLYKPLPAPLQYSNWAAAPTGDSWTWESEVLCRRLIGLDAYNVWFHTEGWFDILAVFAKRSKKVDYPLQLPSFLAAHPEVQRVQRGEVAMSPLGIGTSYVFAISAVIHRYATFWKIDSTEISFHDAANVSIIRFETPEDIARFEAGTRTMFIHQMLSSEAGGRWYCEFPPKIRQRDPTTPPIIAIDGSNTQKKDDAFQIFRRPGTNRVVLRQYAATAIREEDLAPEKPFHELPVLKIAKGIVNDAVNATRIDTVPDVRCYAFSAMHCQGESRKAVVFEMEFEPTGETDPETGRGQYAVVENSLKMELQAQPIVIDEELTQSMYYSWLLGELKFSSPPLVESLNLLLDVWGSCREWKPENLRSAEDVDEEEPEDQDDKDEASEVIPFLQVKLNGSMRTDIEPVVRSALLTFMPAKTFGNDMMNRYIKSKIVADVNIANWESSFQQPWPPEAEPRIVEFFRSCLPCIEGVEKVAAIEAVLAPGALQGDVAQARDTVRAAAQAIGIGTASTFLIQLGILGTQTPFLSPAAQRLDWSVTGTAMLRKFNDLLAQLLVLRRGATQEDTNRIRELIEWHIQFTADRAASQNSQFHTDLSELVTKVGTRRPLTIVLGGDIRRVDENSQFAPDGVTDTTLHFHCGTIAQSAEGIPTPLSCKFHDVNLIANLKGESNVALIVTVNDAAAADPRNAETVVPVQRSQPPLFMHITPMPYPKLIADIASGAFRFHPATIADWQAKNLTLWCDRAIRKWAELQQQRQQ